MQTILGAGGVIGNGITKMLPQYTQKIRLVSRNPVAINVTDELVKADLTDRDQVFQSVQGSEIVYLTVGLTYDLQLWRRHWQNIMTSAIAACKQCNAKLVFFDNVYMYGRVEGWMTEETPFNPCSQKGEIRAKIATQLLEEINQGNLQALIARAADFYGPGATNGIPNRLVMDNFKAGKRAMWLGNDSVRHSLTYAPDAAKASVLLGNTANAYGQTWHLPTDRNALTGKEFIELCAKSFGVKPRYTVLQDWMLRAGGLFDPTVKEVVEMLYQNNDDYLFDSRKFETRFFPATPYGTGIEQTVKSVL